MGRVKTAGLKPFKCEKCGPSFDFDGTPENEVDIPRKDNSTFYILTALPGKGQGLIVVQDIPKGTRIISEKPLAFLSLYNVAPSGSYPLSGNVKTNALPLGTTALEGGLFLVASRINDACVSSCQHTWNNNTGTFENRRRHLKKSFPFDYTCKLCSLLEAARPVIDNRQSEITRLDELLGDGSRLLSNPAKCLEDVHTLLKLLEAENITDARVPRAYYDALQIAIALCCEGDNSPLTIRMKSLVARPAEHRLFGTSSRWRLFEKMIPKRLEGEEFEAWLWRRNR
ncbi:hypothetical protein BKA67DRAFT_593897 [Truncatella angustata]|uniref:Uncharacterized protein n=1 Tax=Truncatella angustata TaxID=152316 RepID=A0A9P8UHR6_9PEZI|nr:uncharacterized protein BKA67DRAFT_593897 [Truncatella angustata]KAH6652449.1 hypothetical protein BKA67DRAFT_593897 [Truncatella angustata]